MVTSKHIGIVALVAFCCFLVITTFGGGLADGDLYFDEMSPFEAVLAFIFNACIISLWFLGMKVAINTNRSLVLCILFWPYSVYLAIMQNGVNREST